MTSEATITLPLSVIEQRISNAQPYEITTKVGIEVDSKGYTKPSAEVKITRRLESGNEINELIHADLSRGVDECMIAISEAQKRVVRSGGGESSVRIV